MSSHRRHKARPNWAKLLQSCRSTLADYVHHLLHQLLAFLFVGVTIGCDEVLIDIPRHLQYDVVVIERPQLI